MKLNDKTLTGITAILLATGVGAAGLFLRTDEVSVEVAPLDIIVVSNVSPLQLAETADVALAPLLTSAPVERTRVPEGPKFTQTPDRIADLSDLTSIEVLPVGDAVTNTDTPTLETPEFDTTSTPVFASVEPASRSESSPEETTLFSGSLMEISPELATLVVPDGLNPLSIKNIDSEVVIVASLQPLLGDQDAPDSVPTGYTRIPSDFCNIEVRATPKSAARVQLRLHAKCHPNTHVTISHAGLQFREKLGDFGELALTIPAFSEFSVFGIELADGLKASTGAYVSGLSRLERVGISWAGSEHTFLHAYEPDTDAIHHVWSYEPRSYAKSLLDGGGYMTSFGNPDVNGAIFTQIYTRPISRNTANSVVALSIETLLDSDNCNSSLQIQTALHSSRGGFSGNRANLLLPDCASSSDSLVTKNLVKDLRVAQN